MAQPLQQSVALILPPADPARWYLPARCAHGLRAQGYTIYWFPDKGAQSAVPAPPIPAGSFAIGCPDDAAAQAVAVIAARHGLHTRLHAPGIPHGARPLRPARVAVYGGGGAPYHHHYVLALAGLKADFVRPSDVMAGKLAGYDVLMVPGGGDEAMRGQIRPLGEEGCRAIARFVEDGGLYIGCCAGAASACIAPPSLARACPEQRHMQLLDVVAWNADAHDPDGLRSPGIGTYVARMLAPDHPILAGLPDMLALTHYNGPLFDHLPTGVTALLTPAQLTENFTPSERFLHRAGDEGTAPRDTLMDRAIRHQRPSAVAGRRGRGRVVLFGSHPEFGTDPLLERPGCASLLLINAVLWHVTAGEVTAPAKPGSGAPHHRPSTPDRGQTRRVVAALDDIAAFIPVNQARIARLRNMRLLPEPPWLDPRRCLALSGLPPAAIWSTTLVALDRWTRELTATAAQVSARLSREEQAPSAALLDRLYRDLTYIPPADQDHGYVGVLPLLERVGHMLEDAWRNRAIDLPPPTADPYQYWDRNPYHLVVGSYLSASGLALGALLQVRSHLCILEGRDDERGEYDAGGV